MEEDIRLVERYLNGDEYAVEELVMKYQRKVYALMYRMSGNIEDAKDLTQETFLLAFKYIKDFRRKSSFHTWLYRIALNTCLNHLSKKKGYTVDLSESIAGGEEHLSSVIEKERKIHINNALKKLSARQKAALLLRAYEGLSLRETARIMDCTEGAVKAHYHNGVRKLRELLKETGYETRS